MYLVVFLGKIVPADTSNKGVKQALPVDIDSPRKGMLYLEKGGIGSARRNRVPEQRH